MDTCIEEIDTIPFKRSYMANKFAPDCGCVTIPFWECRICRISLCYSHYTLTAEQLTSNKTLDGKFDFEPAPENTPYGNMNKGQWFRRVGTSLVWTDVLIVASLLNAELYRQQLVLSFSCFVSSLMVLICLTMAGRRHFLCTWLWGTSAMRWQGMEH